MNATPIQHLIVYIAAQSELCSDEERPIRAEFAPLRPDIGEPVSMGGQVRWTTIKVDLFQGSSEDGKIPWIVYVKPILSGELFPHEYDGHKLPTDEYNQAVEVFLDCLHQDVLDVHINYQDAPMAAEERLLKPEPIEGTTRFKPVQSEWAAIDSEEFTATQENNFSKFFVTYCKRLPIPVSAA